MAFGPAFDAAMDPTRTGLVLTFVLPAESCNLSCPACIIRQRREAESRSLRVGDYLRFIEDVSNSVQVTRIGLQGYEPLLPEAWPYTEAILALAKVKRIPAGLVTNGTHLDCYIPELRQLTPARIVVSLDAPTPEENDHRRGRPGAFAATLRGLRAAAQCAELVSRLCVASILYPGHQADLSGMPSLLEAVGVHSWSVTPLLRIGSRSVSGRFVDSADSILSSVRRLSTAACQHGVIFHVDDEFGFLEDSEELRVAARYRSIVRSEMLLRLV